MSSRYWLSIDEIAQLWSAETGEQADTLKLDLEAWFEEYLKRPKDPDAEGQPVEEDNTNLLMGLLGSRHLQKKTFEIYLKERARPAPAFWVSGEPAAATAVRSAPPAESPPPSSSAPSSALPRSAPQSSDPPSPEPSPSDPQSLPRWMAGPRRRAGRGLAWTGPGSSARTTANEGDGLEQQLTAARQRIAQLDAQLKTAGQEREDLDERLLATRRELDALRRLARKPASQARSGSQKGGAGLVLTVVVALLAVSGGLILWPAQTDHEVAGPAAPPSLEASSSLEALPSPEATSGPAAARSEDASPPEAPPAAPESGLGSYRSSEMSEQPDAGEAAAGAVEQPAARAPDETATRQSAELADARREIANLNAALETSSAEAAELNAQLAKAKEDYTELERSAFETSSAEAAELRAQLAKAREDHAEQQRTVFEASNAELAELKAQLVKMEDDYAKLRRSAVGELEAARAESARSAESAAAKLAALESDLAAAQSKAAELSTAASRSSEEADQLGERLAAAQKDGAASRRDAEGLRAALEATNAEVRSLQGRLSAAQHAVEMTRREAAERAEAQQQEMSRAVTASEAETAALRRELEAERRKIAGLGTAVQTSTAQSSRLNAQLASVLRELDAAREKLGLAPKIVPVEKEVAFDEQPSFSEAAALQADVIPGQLQTASLEPPQNTRPVRLTRDTIYLDDLVLGPDSYLGQEVVVTGALARYFSRYRLQSRTAGDSIAVDIRSLRPEDLSLLEETIEQVGLLGSIRARIKGRVERQSPTSYRLVASDLRLFE